MPSYEINKSELCEVYIVKIECVWEHNGNDSILYANNFIGAFTRGATKEEAIGKMPLEIASYASRIL